jgi:hypothetical protein
MTVSLDNKKTHHFPAAGSRRKNSGFKAEKIRKRD